MQHSKSTVEACLVLTTHSAYYATADGVVRGVTVDLSYLVLYVYSGISDGSSEEFCECRQSLNGQGKVQV